MYTNFHVIGWQLTVYAALVNQLIITIELIEVREKLRVVFFSNALYYQLVTVYFQKCSRPNQRIHWAWTTDGN